MAVLQIPLPATGLRSFSQSVSLDGATYRLTFSWNDRAGHWYLTIADTAGTVLLAGVRVVININILRHRRTPGLPPGQLMFLDDGEVERDPLLADMGTRCRMLYLDAAEVASL